MTRSYFPYVDCFSAFVDEIWFKILALKVYPERSIVLLKNTKRSFYCNLSAKHLPMSCISKLKGIQIFDIKLHFLDLGTASILNSIELKVKY